MALAKNHHKIVKSNEI